MPNRLSVRAVGLWLSATLAAIYVLAMVASLFLFGLATTGSLQAAALGMDWRTVVGFELGLLAITLASFVIAALFVAAFNGLLRPAVQPSAEPTTPLRHSRAARSLAASLVLPAFILLILSAWATVAASRAAPPVAGATAPGAQAMAMPAPINTAYRESEPSFTADGRTMVFNCYNADICVSTLTGSWEDGTWSPPERIAALNTEYEEVEPIISPSGDTLTFTSSRPAGFLRGVPFLSPFLIFLRLVDELAPARAAGPYFGGLGLNDIWVSERIGGVWSEPRNLSDVDGAPPVNTRFGDHCLFFSADGEEAFWTSTRPGGLGGNDIWTSRLEDGTWSEPEYLGPDVNSAASEHTSIPAPDGRSLFVTTTRPGGFGAEDIYLTTRDAVGAWGPLANVGPLVNGPGDDRCPAWTPDLRYFLFDSVREGGSGGRDLWWVYFNSVQR